MSFNLSYWYKDIVKEDTLFSYKGVMTDTKISDILDDIEDIFDKKDETKKIVKRIYNISIETLQNLYHHSDNFDIIKDGKVEAVSNTVFILKQNSEGKYQIVTGNFVKKNNIRVLKERIDQLNFLNKNEVKSLYKLILNNEEFSKKGGGGLGIIDLVKRTGQSLNYNFYYFNEEYIFFSLRIAI